MLLIPGTGNGERESGNKCTAVTRMRIQNGGQKKRKGFKRNSLGKREFLPAVPADDPYVLVRAETDWHWDKQSMLWRLSRKSNQMSRVLSKRFQHCTTVLRFH